MNREFNTWRDPYDAGFCTCRPKKITIESGLTVFVGCNGSGKTTLLNNIESELSKSITPFTKFNNLSDGGHHSIGSMLFNDNMSMAFHLMTASEGEAIGANIGMWVGGIRDFLKTGNYRTNSREERMTDFFVDKDEDYNNRIAQLASHKERWILMDATDSGYSVDNIIELKALFGIIEEDALNLNKELYILITANEYELARGEQCFDVNEGKYITFSSYDDYRDFIIASRKKKDKRSEDKKK